MNTIKESSLGTNKINIRNMVDVRIILSGLWVARVLSGLQGDSTRFHDPVALNELVAGTTDIPVTNDDAVGIVNNIGSSNLYEFPVPGVERKSESSGKPQHRHILCCLGNFLFDLRLQPRPRL